MLMSPTPVAMVLAAGLGTRMRPITATIPKPLVPVGGRPLIDHALDRLAASGVTTAVVNVHYLADLLERHLRGRTEPRILISDERGEVLETGGGIKKALPLLGEQFILLNSDSLWIEGARSNLDGLMRAWDPARMDILLLLAPTEASTGYDGSGDFHMNEAGLLARRTRGEPAPYVYAGVAMLKAGLFSDTPDGPFSLNLLFDRAISAGRLAGVRLDGEWLHVGTPDQVLAAEERLTACGR